MTITDRIIVALDDMQKAPNLISDLTEIGIKHFKFGPEAMMHEDRFWTCLRVLEIKEGASFFLDLKLYDTPDTVTRTIKQAFDIGAQFVTVYADQAVMEAAMSARPSRSNANVLAVFRLTNYGDTTTLSRTDHNWYSLCLNHCDGIVAPASYIKELRHEPYTGKIFVAPGIRPLGHKPNNHFKPATPIQAIGAGADYIGIGRPITEADDPVAAAKVIIADAVDN